MEAPFQLPPPDYSDRGPSVVACAVVGIVVPTVAVVLRFWSRRVTTALYLWWDDWAIIATLIFSHVFLSVNIYWTTIGLGQHTWMTPLELVPENAVVNRVALVLYASTIWMIKISALTFYARIFQRSKAFTYTLWTIGAICTAWWIATCIVPWMFCHPLELNVNPLLPGECRDSIDWYLGSAFLNAFMDLVVLVTPVPATWRLQMSLKKRLAVMGVFLLGYMSAFLSFARFIIIVRDPEMLSANPESDPSWDLVPLLYLSMLEAPLAILALCAPSINQLAARAIKHRSLASLFSSQSHPTSSNVGSPGVRGYKLGSAGKGSHTGSSISRPWQAADASSTTAIHEPPAGGPREWRSEDIPMGAIYVSRDVEIASYQEKDRV